MYVQSLCTFKVVRMVVIRLYVRHGSLVLGVIVVSCVTDAS